MAPREEQAALAAGTAQLSKLFESLRSISAEASKSGGEVGDDALQLLLEMKKRCRAAFLTADRLAARLDEAKKRAEERDLSLENLLYEKVYLEREIERCSKFEMKECNKIDLVPEAEFHASASDELKANLGDEADEADAKAHQLQLARLTHELQLREGLRERLAALEDSKAKVHQNTLDKRDFLEELPSKMKGIREAAAPLQEHFGEPVLERLGKHAMCRELPTPLYMVFCQLEAYADSFGGVEVSVERDADPGAAAAAMEVDEKTDQHDKVGSGGKRKRGGDGKGDKGRKLARSDSAEEGVTTAAAAAAAAAAGEPEKEEASSGKKKANEAAAAAAAAAAVAAAAAAAADLYKSAGVAVKARLHSPGKQVDVTLRFEFYPALGAVTVEAVDQAGLLANIYPNDTGEQLPSHGAAQAARRGASPLEHIRGRPFKWLQWLAGIYKLDPDGPQDDQQPSTRDIVRSILDRVRAQESLSEQLATLEKRPHPVPVHPDAAGLFPAGASTKLVKWEETGAETADERIGSKRLSVGGVPVFYGAGSGRDPSQEAASWTNFGRRCFHGVLESKDGTQVEAIVQVFVDYPRRAPHFSLFPAGNAMLQTIEREVNDYASELSAGDGMSLLSHQLRRLQMCLGVLAEASGKAASESGEDDGEEGDPKQGSGEKGRGTKASSSTMERKFRGRDRRLAFVYEPQSRTFVHR